MSAKHKIMSVLKQLTPVSYVVFIGRLGVGSAGTYTAKRVILLARALTRAQAAEAYSEIIRHCEAYRARMG